MANNILLTGAAGYMCVLILPRSSHPNPLIIW